MAREPQSPPKLDEAATKRLTEIASRMGTCMSTAMSASHPTSPE